MQKIEKYTLVGFTASCASDSRRHIVSRGFGPLIGVPEDPVTGSYHCALAPYWSRRLEGLEAGDEIAGVQGGKRRGEIRFVWLEKEGRVLLRGNAVEGELIIRRVRVKCADALSYVQSLPVPCGWRERIRIGRDPIFSSVIGYVT